MCAQYAGFVLRDLRVHLDLVSGICCAISFYAPWILWRLWLRLQGSLDAAVDGGGASLQQVALVSRRTVSCF